MKYFRQISLWVLLLITAVFPCQAQAGDHMTVDFLGEQFTVPAGPSLWVHFSGPLSELNVEKFTEALSRSNYQPLVQELLKEKKNRNLNDWIFYQLIRKAAARFCPKQENYFGYTLYKWFLLTRCGYDASIRISKEKMLFFVKTEEDIYNIPCYQKNNLQFVCLNYHDYGSYIDFSSELFIEIPLPKNPEGNAFSYKITSMPEFKAADYQEKKIDFSFYRQHYQLNIKLNPQVKTLFLNYPAVDFASSFNIPLSRETYLSLIPALLSHIKGMTVKTGVNYLMHFTRYAFLFKKDTEIFGAEKRLTPEQTLLYDESDCEDRAALFFYLVKEIYNLPMIVLSYPEHITVAVKFDKPVGHPIVFNGEKYSICEPTPQEEDLGLGEISPALAKTRYEIVYAYQPAVR